MSAEKDNLRGTLCNSICNVSLYPERAQSHLLGRDMSDVLDRTADNLLAAGYRKTRTVTTVEELDALPIGSVVRTSGIEHKCEPRVAMKEGFWRNESEWLVADDSEWCLSSDELDDLPAAVLYEPQL